MAQRERADYGKGVLHLEADEATSVSPKLLADKLLKLFLDPSYEPPLLPKAALELLQMTRRSNVNMAEVVQLLSQDAMLAGRVLRVAQSPVYSGGSAVTTLDQAVFRLGLQHVTDIFFQVSVNSRMFRVKQYEGIATQLRRHCTATAHLARVLCKHTALHDDYAFLCGLLHDVGAAACLMAAPEGEAQENAVPLEILWPAVVEAHERTTELLGRLWSLPNDMQLATGHHHHYRISGYPHPVAAAVCVADFLATRIGYGVPDDTDTRLAEEAIVELGLNTATLDQVAEEAEKIIVSIGID